jgi:hypothetical protein|tara:strand:- start:186 stop:683 length:498 start_codon:yes stop_codon:yes gene_type:complete
MGIKAVGAQFDQNQNFPPDAEIIFREWCINTTAITNLCSSRVATRLPRSAELPFLTIFNAGGTLMSPTSEAAVTGAAITVDAYAGRWGGGGTTSQPDYANAYALANAVAESAFKMKSTRVVTPTTNTAAVIYSMEVQGLPSRIEETDTGLGHYQLSLIMYYRGLD